MLLATLPTHTVGVLLHRQCVAAQECLTKMFLQMLDAVPWDEEFIGSVPD